MGETVEAYIYQPAESEKRWMGETATHFLATGALTGAAFALVEEQAKRGVSVPLHLHRADMESFFVLEGEISFFLGNEAPVRAVAGAFAHIPGGTVHGFRIESEIARYLILTTPRHADFYRAITSPVPFAAIEGSVIGQACEKYGVEFVGALPG